MLIDDIKIKVSAGNGGKGAVAFNTNMKSLGPTGAMGGNGGSVYTEGVSDISALGQFRFKKEFKAENGLDGRGQFRDGHDGKDLILKLPIGTCIHNLTNNKEVSIEKTGERVLIAKGGLGGRGNFHFRSSRNTSPKESRPGSLGESFEFRFELKLIADVGFVGLPNVGKSSLLNALTNARSKVANYPFTTLEPNLGAYYELILADIPGLIEGSSSGRGLGIKFLRHIERTRILFHFISAESSTPAKDYKTVREELGRYNEALLEKPEQIFLTKSDLATGTELKKKIAALSAIGAAPALVSKYGGQGSASGGKKILNNVIAISINDKTSIKNVGKTLNDIKKEK